MEGRTRKTWLVAILVVLAALVAVRQLTRAPAPSGGADAGSPVSDSGARSARGPLAVRPTRPLWLPAASAGRDAPTVGGGFEGKVVSSSTGSGVPEASLTFARDGSTTTVRAAVDGTFHFEPMAPGAFALVLAAADGYLPFAPPWGNSPLTFVARAGERVRGIVVQLTPAVTYVGVVQDERGAPVEGASLRVLGDDGPGKLASTDVRGEARFNAPDDALVEARHPAHAIGRARVDLGAQVSHRVVIRMGPRSGAILDEVISGRVLGPGAAAIADALVVATAHTDQPGSSDASLRPTIAAMTDAEGRFTLSGLDAERYDVLATHDGYAPASAPSVTSGTIDLALELDAGGRLTGRVTDGSTGAPVVAFSVVVDAIRGPIEREPFLRTTFFDAEGRYDLGGLAPGGYAVTVVALGYAPAEHAPVALPDPPAEVAEDFALGRGGRVTGLVIEEVTRTPLEGARVSVEGRLPGVGSTSLLAATTTDALGRFELSGLASGLRSIAVVAADHNGRIVSGLPVREGGDVGPITVELGRTKDGEEPRLELTGIGAVLASKDDALRIGEVLPGGGAALAGLVPGDAIVAVDGEAVVSLGFEGSIQRIRGPEGSTVTLTVRKATGEAAVLAVVRKRVSK